MDNCVLLISKMALVDSSTVLEIIVPRATETALSMPATVHLQCNTMLRPNVANGHVMTFSSALQSPTNSKPLIPVLQMPEAIKRLWTSPSPELATLLRLAFSFASISCN